MGKNGIAIYSRKSKFTGRGESVENQVGLCREYIRIHYGEEAEKRVSVYEDEGFSGKTLERPRFRMMMEAAKRGELEAVVVYRLDRISRNIGDFAGLIEKLGAMGISFVSIREQFDTESPMGRAMMYIASVFSQLERETIAERIRDNMIELSKTGRWLGGAVPTGYCSKEIAERQKDGRLRKFFCLETIPAQAELVRSIFEKFVETGTVSGTLRWLEEKGIVSKNGKIFSRHTLCGILENPVYACADEDVREYFREKGAEIFASGREFDGNYGLIAYNRTRQIRGRGHETRQMTEWVVAIGGHKGLVRGKDWVKAQRLLEKNRSGKRSHQKHHTALLGGLLFCAQCGASMRPKLMRGMVGNKRKFVYQCTGKEKKNGCSMKNADGNLLDESLLDILGNFPRDEEIFVQELSEYVRMFDRKRKEISEEEKGYKRCIEAKEGEIQELIKALAKASGTAAEGYILERIELLHRECSILQESLTRQENKEWPDKELQESCTQLSSFRILLKTGSVTEQRMVVNNLIEKALWDGECLQLYPVGYAQKSVEEESGHSRIFID